MQFNRRNINKRLRNGDIISSSLYSTSSSGGGSSSGGVLSGNYLPATQNENEVYIVPHYVTFQESTADAEGNEVIKKLLEITTDGIKVNGNIIASGEVSAYGSGTTSGGGTSGGGVLPYDGLDSTAIDIPLSANQGRVLKTLIDTIDVGDLDLSNYVTTVKVGDTSYSATTNTISLPSYPTLTTLSGVSTSTFNTHSGNTTLHITADERTKWNNSLTSAHSHSNKTVIDSITSDSVNKWNNKLDKSVWDDVFEIDEKGNLKVKTNLYGIGEISAYGSGATSGGGTSGGGALPYDGLDSTSTELSLSANQGRVLKNLIDTLDVGDIDLSGYSKTSHTHSNYSTTGHTHTIANISNLQSTLNAKSDSGHTHNYTSKVKIGNTEYSVSANTISLPAYPTLTTLGAASSTDLGNHTANTTAHITATERTNWNKAYTNNHTHSNKSVIDGITSTKVSNWDNVYKNWNDIFEIDTNGNLKVKVNLIGLGEVSAYGSGTTSGGGTSGALPYDGLDSTATDVALSANQGRVLKNLIDTLDVGDIDLSGYSKTSHTHSNYSTTGHTHSIANITNLQSTLDGKSGTGHSHSNYSTTSHTHSNYSVTSHTHSNYVDLTSVQEITGRKDFKGGIRLYIGNSITDENGYGVVGVNPTGWTGLPSDGTAIGLGTTTSPLYLRSNGTLKHYRADKSTSYTIIDSSNSAHTHSNYATTTNFNSHSANTTLHITSTERTNWNTAYNNNHTHSNKSVIDGITSTKVSNWDGIVTDWNKVFSLDSSGNLKVKVNLIGEKEISAYGSGTTSGGGASGTLPYDGLDSTSTDVALSANQGRVLKNLIDTLDIGDIDLSGYSKTSHTHSNYSVTSHTHSNYSTTGHTHTIANISNLQSTLDGKSGTGHTHSAYSPTSHTHSNYSTTGHTHSTYYDSAISRTKNTVLAAPNGSDGTATFRSLVAADIPSLAISKITNLQSTLDGKSGTGHSHSNYSTTSHTHSTLTFSAGTFSAKTYNPSGATTVNIPTNTTHLTNGSGYITSAATVANATKFNGYTMRSGVSFVNNSIDCHIQYIIDATALSTSNFYPITFGSGPKDLYVNMYSTGGNSSAAYNMNKLEFTLRGQGWTDTPQGLTVHFYNCYTASETTIGCIGMGTEGGVRTVWVRGGLTYYVIANCPPTLRTSTYTSSNEVYSVGTNFYGGTNTKVSIKWTPQNTSGIGTLYHSNGIALGGGLSIASNASIGGTLTTTGLATFNGNFSAPAGTTSNMVSSSFQWRNQYVAQLSTAGWYRFATSKRANNAGGTYIFSISRDYYNSNNESYLIAATLDYGGCNWTQLAGNAQTQLITKVRCTYTNNSTMYFDLYYSGTVQNGVYVNCLGDANCQTPTLVTSALSVTNETSLTNGFKTGTKSAYPITLYRNNSNGGVYIQYGALNQLTKTWAAGVDTQHRFAWYYKDTSAGTDTLKMNLNSGGTLSSDYWLLNNSSTNPYLKLVHTYNSTTTNWYAQAYNGYLYLGAGSSKSLRIDSNGNCLSTAEITAHSDRRLKSDIKPLDNRGELQPKTFVKDGKKCIGFIAQDVEELYPELVITDESSEEKYKSLNYAQLTAVLAAQINELRKEINELKNKME